MVHLLAWMERQVYRHASSVVVLAKGSEPFVRERGKSNGLLQWP